MESEVHSWDMVGALLDVSVAPERLRDLISLWDARILGSGVDRIVSLSDVSGSEFARQVAGAVRILENIRAAERQQFNDTLSSIRGASMVLSEDGEVIAANDAARVAFGLMPGDTIRSMPLDSEARAEFAQRIAGVAAAGVLCDDVVRLRPEGPDRVIHVHLRAIQGGRRRPVVLAVTTEHAWPAEVSRVLDRVFDLAPAEIEVLRLLTAGATVASISKATRRSRGTLRAQIHAILQKTETRNQAEAVRLAMLLIDSMRAETQPRRSLPAPEPHQRYFRMPDGRRIEVVSFGAQNGRPVLWMQSFYGRIRLPRSAERELARRGLRVVLPIRSGFGGSDPAPKGRNLFDVAVADIGSVMTQLRISAAPVVAPDDSIRLALMLAQVEPARVRHVFGLGSFFPIRNEDQYRRLFPLARFFRSCARYQPKVAALHDARGPSDGVWPWCRPLPARSLRQFSGRRARLRGSRDRRGGCCGYRLHVLGRWPVGGGVPGRTRSRSSGLAGGPRPSCLSGHVDSRRAGRKLPPRNSRSTIARSIRPGATSAFRTRGSFWPFPVGGMSSTSSRRPAASSPARASELTMSEPGLADVRTEKMRRVYHMIDAELDY